MGEGNGTVPYAALAKAVNAAAEAEPDGEDAGELDAATRMRAAKTDREYASALKDFVRIVRRRGD